MMGQTTLCMALVLCIAMAAAKPYESEKWKAPDDGGVQSGKWMSWQPIEDKDLSSDIAGDDKSEIEMPENEACHNVYCHIGRVCEVNARGKGECVCAGQDYCEGHKKRVCGTDGGWYPSHCELHRMACVKQLHIGIDHSGKKCDEKQSLISKATPPKVSVQVLKIKKEDDEEVGDKDKDDEKNIVAVEDVKKIEQVKPCTELEYERLKGSLVQYHCARLGEKSCLEDGSKKVFVANVMFTYYDRNNDKVLEEADLVDIEQRDHLERLSQYCSLTDMLSFDDKDEDGKVTLTEFYRAFRVPTVVLDDALKVFTTLVTVGNSIELKCDVKGATETVWKRNGAELEEDTSDDIKVFADGSLYVSNLGLGHMGNYTCQDRYNDHVVQTHILKVQMTPVVKVSPATQFHTSGSTVTLKCHADGIPEPQILWEMNESPLPDDQEGKHYMRLQSNSTLEIKSAVYTKDTGAYKCKGVNSAGVSQDIATVFIENSDVPLYSTLDELYEVFLVFHDDGINLYEPSHCHIEHQVAAKFSMFKTVPEIGDTVPTLCVEGEACSWGAAVNVMNRFIYVTQPKLNRVVVVEIKDRYNPVELIPTDKVPVKIHYIAHLDQVWVLCWNEHKDSGSKTVIVIRQASQELQHHTVHTQPIGDRFDMVKDMFLPPNSDLKMQYRHGYVVHNEQKGLYKLDLDEMKYTKVIDLNQYQCVPKSVTFIPIGGNVMVHCKSPAGKAAKSAHIIMDYITDKVLSYHETAGEAYLSPDGRYLVTVDDEGNNVLVHRVHDDGNVEHMYDEYTNLKISGVTFFPSERGRSYDFYATSSTKNELLYINLASGKVEMIEGVGEATDTSESMWSDKARPIVGGGMFGEYLMTPAKGSVFIIDGKRRHVQCQWQEIVNGNVIVWASPKGL